MSNLENKRVKKKSITNEKKHKKEKRVSVISPMFIVEDFVTSDYLPPLVSKHDPTYGRLGLEPRHIAPPKIKVKPVTISEPSKPVLPS